MERRKSARIPLDIPCLLTLILNYEEKYQAMVVDVSPGGVQLGLSPGFPHDTLETGVPVTLSEVPAPLAGLLDGAHGKIAWVGVRCCGIRLNKDLPAHLLDAVELARL
ncbi:MAG: hypothetical protein DELT_01306 [Desulfovibrio sp.]